MDRGAGTGLKLGQCRCDKASDGALMHDDQSMLIQHAAIAGLAAGVIFLILEVLATWILGTSPWAPLRMTAAIVMGHSAASQSATFDPSVTLVALVVHFALSLIFGLILAAIMASFSLDSSIGMASLVS
jgi:hypothetical protein